MTASQRIRATDLYPRVSFERGGGWQDLPGYPGRRFARTARSGEDSPLF
ncbi:MAG: hypothetical protein MZU97_07915 [Bacillus subtilis]|nr:hypothetical protein [Bacillus subtilis]